MLSPLDLQGKRITAKRKKYDKADMDEYLDFVFENYKENNFRLELSHLIVNIARGTNSPMLGTFHCTNGEYVPSIRKCIVSKKDLDFTDDLLEKIKITELEKQNLNNHNILYLDITDTYDFENL